MNAEHFCWGPFLITCRRQTKRSAQALKLEHLEEAGLDLVRRAFLEPEIQISTFLQFVGSGHLEKAEPGGIPGCGIRRAGLLPPFLLLIPRRGSAFVFHILPNDDARLLVTPVAAVRPRTMCGSRSRVLEPPLDFVELPPVAEVRTTKVRRVQDTQKSCHALKFLVMESQAQHRMPLEKQPEFRPITKRRELAFLEGLLALHETPESRLHSHDQGADRPVCPHRPTHPLDSLDKRRRISQPPELLSTAVHSHEGLDGASGLPPPARGIAS
eukprot:scaffold2044_cov247-Pinguiococcus_pyrenoidosus.AAC.2